MSAVLLCVNLFCVSVLECIYLDYDEPSLQLKVMGKIIAFIYLFIIKFIQSPRNISVLEIEVIGFN